MRKVLSLVLLAVVMLAVDGYAQATAPNNYTTRYRLRQWADGANPSADSINANWAQIDSSLRYPRYTYQDSLIIGATASPSVVKLYVDGTARIDSLLVDGNTRLDGNVNIAGIVPHFAVNDSLTIGNIAGINGILRIITNTFGPLEPWYGRVVYAGGADATLTFPAITGTVALLAGDQDFTDMGNIIGDSLNVSGGAVVGGHASVTGNATIGGYATADSATLGVAEVGSVLRMLDASQDGYYAIFRNVGAFSSTVYYELPELSGTLALTGAGMDVAFDSVYATSGIRTQGDVWKATTAYTNPDYVFEDHYTGESSNPAYDGLRPLTEIEAYTKENHRLPGIKDEPTGIFKRADFVLENVEKLYLYLIAQDKELKRLRSEVEALKGR